MSKSDQRPCGSAQKKTSDISPDTKGRLIAGVLNVVAAAMKIVNNFLH